MFPITASASRLPPLSPPSPPGANEDMYSAGSSSSNSLNRPLAPPPLNTMPSRTESIRSAMSQVIVTPNDTGDSNPMSRSQQQLPSVIHLEEPIVIDNPMNGQSGMQNNTPPNGNGGEADYFDMNLKTASNSNMLNPPMASPAHLHSSSPFSRSFPSPSANRTATQHPYRRPNATNSPARLHAELQGGGNGKPIFAIPFTPDGSSTYMNQGSAMSSTDVSMDAKMERVPSSDSDPSTLSWQRWHRPSFPFPPTAGNTYEFEQQSALELAAPVNYSS